MDKDRFAFYINKGADYFEKKDLNLAISFFKKAYNLSPSSSEANFNLGLCYQLKKAGEKAAFHFLKAIRQNPNDFNALNNLGNAYVLRGKIDEAIESYKRAVKINPRLSEGWQNLGICYQEKGRLEEAINYYLKSLEINPGGQAVLNNLALAYINIGHLEQSKKTYENLIDSDPNVYTALGNLGAMLLRSDPERALNLLERANGLAPRSADILYNLGIVYHVAGQIAKSLKTFQKVLQVDPNYRQVYGQLYLRYRTFAMWDEAEKIFPRMRKYTDEALKEKTVTTESPYISVLTSQDPKRNREIAGAWSNNDKNLVSGYRFKPEYRKKKKGDKISVGYISADFHDHATLHLLSGVLRNHDKKKFRIYAYSYGYVEKGKYRKLAQKEVDKFRDIRELSDLDAAKAINKDGIDVLVDLKGHTSGCRLGIMALRPAPVSITWLGFPGTTGSDFIDYIIADRTVLPETATKYISEKILYMPHAYQPTDNKQPVTERIFTRQQMGLPGDPDAFVFSSFNQVHKIEPEVFGVWMKILKRVPGSILWLWVDSHIAAGNFRKEAVKRGVDPARIVFADPLPKDQHLKRLKLSDLALDTFAYNGHTTTSDCLWGGVPVVTLKGKHFASRVSASLLVSIGLSELITASPAEYEELAVSLAKDPKKMAAIRHKLARNRLTSPLFDTEGFTKDLEDIYEKTHRKFRR